jgi:hypothetical protein
MKNYYVILLAIASFTFAHLTSFSQGEPARLETKLNQVYTEYDLSGDGVILAIIDRGIDYSHPDFIDENGKTRLLYLYDMINPEGANDPNNPYGIGTIYDEDDINTALETDGPPISEDRYGHGTATAGIAGGNGSGTASGEFHGVAHNARYIIIKATQDYFPPYDGQPGQDGFYDPTYIPVAIQFTADKINEFDMPSVTLLNMGSIGGPTDGTSSIARAIDSFVEQGFPFVCGVGDDGGNYNHASATLAEAETIDLTFEKNVAGNLRFDLWYDETDRFEVTITRPDNTTEGPFAAPASANDKDDRFLQGMNYYHRGADMEFWSATSNRREIMIDFTGATGEYKVSLKATTVGGSGSFHATLNPSNFSYDNKFTSYQVWGHSINDFASATKAIVPTDYVVKNNWIDMDGNPREMTNQGVQGGLWAGSSIGPTQDGRMGVDFAVPGEVLFAAYSPGTYYSSFDWLLVQGGENKYGIQNAVSAAAPLTMGVIALMLEYRPNLSPSALESALKNSATKDNFTDSIANRAWGHGKLNAYQAIKEIEFLSTPETEKELKSLTMYPNPADDFIKLQSDISSEELEVRIYNNMGQLVMQTSTSSGDRINISNLKPGLYHLLSSSNRQVAKGKFIRN